MSGMSDAQKHLPDPPADLDAEFRRELDRAETLAEARLRREPRNVTARYDVGSVRGLRASYTASIEGSLRAAFGTARGAFNAQESVLDLDPDHVQANVVVGTYRYLVSSLGLMSRWLAYVAGFGGGRERGIEMIESALEAGDAMVEAGTALMLIYSREERHESTHRLALRLAERYPGNRLFRLEAGAAAVRAGLNGQAEAILSRGLDALAADTRPRVPGERAIWLYQRGLARLQQNRLDEAETDLKAALESEPYGWMHGRILIGLGKLHDLHDRRSEARKAYAEGRAICEALADVVGADMARTLERTPYSLHGGLDR
jgi:tetratricopeptide (TPR) repeat protein